MERGHTGTRAEIQIAFLLAHKANVIHLHATTQRVHTNIHVSSSPPCSFGATVSAPSHSWCLAREIRRPPQLGLLPAAVAAAAAASCGASGAAASRSGPYRSSSSIRQSCCPNSRRVFVLSRPCASPSPRPLAYTTTRPVVYAGRSPDRERESDKRAEGVESVGWSRVASCIPVVRGKCCFRSP